MTQALVDALTMAAVFLVDRPDDAGVLGGIAVSNGGGVILGAVVDNDDLHPLAAGEQTVDTLFHVVLGIVAGDGDGKQFHGQHPLTFLMIRTVYICRAEKARKKGRLRKI
jgi:hypothetical protein